ncbi:MAG: hypothetical protein AAFO75_13905 [Pseudomonadota bacterium]
MVRFPGNREDIVRQLEREANIAAQAYEEAVQKNERAYRIERMEDLVDDLAERLDELETSLFNELSIVMHDDVDGRFTLVREGREFEVRARDDMTIAVNGQIVHPDPQFPVLTMSLYDNVLQRVLSWADPSTAGPRRLGNV